MSPSNLKLLRQCHGQLKNDRRLCFSGTTTILSYVMLGDVAAESRINPSVSRLWLALAVGAFLSSAFPDQAIRAQESGLPGGRVVDCLVRSYDCDGLDSGRSGPGAYARWKADFNLPFDH